MRRSAGVALASATLIMAGMHAVQADVLRTVEGSLGVVVDSRTFIEGTSYHGEPAELTLQEHHFSYHKRVVNGCATDTIPTFSIGAAQYFMERYADVVLWCSTGAPETELDPGGLVVEYYINHVHRDSVYNRYLRRGIYGQSEIFRTTHGAYHVIGVRPDFIDNHCRFAPLSIMMSSSCQSDDWHEAWGCGAHLGYPDEVSVVETARAEIDTVFTRMSGLRGTTMRASEHLGTGLTCVRRGATDLVLSPAVVDIYPPPDHVFEGSTVSGYVDFDTAIDVDGLCSESIQSEGFYDAHGVFNPVFEITAITQVSDTRLTFRVKALWKDATYVRVRAGHILGSGSIDRHLNGNTEPPGQGGATCGANCRPPDQDDYAVPYVSEAGAQPGAAVTLLLASRDGSGVAVRWATESELHTDVFELSRSADAGQSWTCLADSINHQAGPYEGATYEFIDALGAVGDWYHLVEIESDGDRVHCGYVQATVEARESPSRVGPGSEEAGRHGADPGHPQVVSPVARGSTPDALIICPQAWLPALGDLPTHWEATRGIQDAQVVALESIAADPSEDDIKDCVRSFAENLEYVLLVGDANRLLPELDIIPSHYMPYEEGWGDTVYAWDGWYGDLDDDGLSEIAVGRFIANSSSDVSVLVEKSLAYDETAEAPWRRETLALIYDACGSTSWLHDMAQAVVEMLPDMLNRVALFDSDFPFPQAYPEREAATIAHWDLGMHLVVALGESSNRVSLVEFLDKACGFTTEMLSENGCFPIVLGNCCNLGDFARGETLYYGRELMADLQLAENKGSLVWLASTENSQQWINYVLASEFANRIDMNGSLTLGEIWRQVKAATLSDYPQALQAIQMWSFFGDPTIRMTWTDIQVGVSEETPTGAFSLMQCYPNPFNPATEIRYELASMSEISLRIYDCAGRVVQTLVSETQPAGCYRVAWDGRSTSGEPVASGVYFCELAAGGLTANAKMVLLR